MKHPWRWSIILSIAGGLLVFFHSKNMHPATVEQYAEALLGCVVKVSILALPCTHFLAWLTSGFRRRTERAAPRRQARSGGKHRAGAARRQGRASGPKRRAGSGRSRHYAVAWAADDGPARERHATPQFNTNGMLMVGTTGMDVTGHGFGDAFAR